MFWDLERVFSTVEVEYANVKIMNIFYCRTRKDNSAENFAVIRRIAVNILKKYSAKMSLARKRRKCFYEA